MSAKETLLISKNSDTNHLSAIFTHVLTLVLIPYYKYIKTKKRLILKVIYREAVQNTC